MLAGVCALTGGCFGGGPHGPRLVSDPNPSNKIPAIKASVASGDKAALAQLVKDLDSDDPAVRFYSIGGLERLTHETFGYHYYDDDAQRAPAIEKWKVWLSGFRAGEKVPNPEHAR